MSESGVFNNAIFWVDVDKISPNPYQPRREFDEAALRSLAESIRQYGVLQPLVVTRKEEVKPDGGLLATYELIAGERRLRASKLAGISQVPVVIRTGEQNDREKLELAIIENLQREDLNPIDRAFAFKRLVDEFGFKHSDVAQKVGKSREYVSNSIRLLGLPQDAVEALQQGKISEGHARPLLMLGDRPAEQLTLFKEIMFKRLTVREAERIARHIAVDKVRKKELMPDPLVIEFEGKLSEKLGTRVHVERKGSPDAGGRIFIDFFSNDDLAKILDMVQRSEGAIALTSLDAFIARKQAAAEVPAEAMQSSFAAGAAPTPQPASLAAAEHIGIVGSKSQAEHVLESPKIDPLVENDIPLAELAKDQNEPIPTLEQVAQEEAKTHTHEKENEENEDENLYSIKDFTV